ncbi:MAG TPA: ABC transporter permease [Vicinamibacterales bacterium]|nr:ABC transporter permease [Vicinamibacterales bacterium]
MRWALFTEIVAMSWDTLRNNKMRSALTVLGVVIGITSIVGITSLIRGFDQSFRDLVRQIGSDTIIVQKSSGLSMGSGADFEAILRRPNITPLDGDAIEQADSVQTVDVTIGAGSPFDIIQQRVSYRGERTTPLVTIGTTERWPYVNQLVLEAGRFFTGVEVQRRQNVIVLGQTAYVALFPSLDPIGKQVRLGIQPFTVVGVMAKRPSLGGFNLGADDFVVIPHTTYAKIFGVRTNALARGTMRSMQITAVPREGVSRETAIAEIEEIMRIRHGLRLDEPNDFEVMTQDAVLEFWDQISQATFLALIALSSIALMVGGIGVMSIMTISVTERTREIGVRKALGARRTEVLWQFLLEAVFLTSVGGILGIVAGAGVGVIVHLATGFPVSLPWWSFAIGIGFSAGVGVFFGMIPAIRAARLDPIEALRYE